MNRVANKLSSRMTFMSKYYLLPNSDYKAWKKQNPVLSLTLESGKKGPLGSLKIELFENIVPKTSENFRQLLLGKAAHQNKPLSLVGSIFHQIFPNGYARTGRLNGGNRSIYGKTFGDESFEVLHTRPGLLSSVSNGNSNSSEFMITFGPCPYFDHKQVVFGEVIDGLDVLNYIENQGSKGGFTRDQIKIAKCQQLKLPHHAFTRVSNGLIERISRHGHHHDAHDSHHAQPKHVVIEEHFKSSKTGTNHHDQPYHSGSHH